MKSYGLFGLIVLFACGCTKSECEPLQGLNDCDETYSSALEGTWVGFRFNDGDTMIITAIDDNHILINDQISGTAGWAVLQFPSQRVLLEGWTDSLTVWGEAVLTDISCGGVNTLWGAKEMHLYLTYQNETDTIEESSNFHSCYR